MGDVLVYVELGRDSQVLPPSLEALTAGQRIAQAHGLGLAAVVAGSGTDKAVAFLGQYPIKSILTADDPLLEHYHPEYFTQALVSICREARPGYLVMAETFQSIDLAPRLAFALDSGLVTGCVSLDFDAGETLFIKPVYSGNVMASYSVEGDLRLATFRAKAFDPMKPQDGSKPEVRPVQVKPDPGSVRIQPMEQVLSRDGNGQGLETAEIVVSGGRGLGGPDGFGILRELARELGGVVGASRPPCDLGWIEPSAQVGITGTIVAPELYIAVGISGTTQHVGGMEGSKTVVAINEREDAPIFKIADFGVVDDYAKVLPGFLEGLRQSR